MLDPFEGLAASHAAEYLRAALESGNVTHAYLIAGPAGCGHDQVALRLASALVADGDPEQFQIAARGTHPDVHVMQPASSSGYLVDQVRDAVRDATLAPVRAARKVYIVQEADRMKGAPANAFLKTLEEPPASVHIILLATTEGGVLNTLRSRCQVLTMAAASAGEDPRAAASAELMGRVLAGIGRGAGNKLVLTMAKDLVEAANKGIDDLKDAHAAAEQNAADYLTAGARKELADAHKREVTKEQRAGLTSMLDAAESWLRDCMMAAAGAPELSHATNAAAQGALGFGTESEDGTFVDPTKLDIANAVGIAGIIRALDAVDQTRKRIASNVTPQLAMEAMLLEIREALCPR